MAQRAVKASYWTDPRIRQLSANGRLVALYLMTCPQSHIGGLYYLGLSQAAAQTGLTSRAMREALAELERVGFARFDESTEEVWVVNMLRHQSRSPKVLASVAKFLAEIHSSGLIDGLMSYYEGFAIPYRYPTDTLSRGYRYLPDTDTDSDTDSEGVGGVGGGVLPESERLVEYFNRRCRDANLGRRANAATHDKRVRRLLKAGYSERQARLVIFWALNGPEKWGESETLSKHLQLETLLKTTSSNGTRTFPDYLERAEEWVVEKWGQERLDSMYAEVEQAKEAISA